MTVRTRNLLVGAGMSALLAAAGLAAGSLPAQAQDEAALSLEAVSTDIAPGVQQENAKPFKFRVTNAAGAADAVDVTYTVDTSDLGNRIGFVVPAGCDQSGDEYTCAIGDIPADSSEEFGVPLFVNGRRGGAGSITVTVNSTTADSDLGDNTATTTIRITGPGFDLVSFTTDVNGDAAASAPRVLVIPGETGELGWIFGNYGDRPVTGLSWLVTLPAGAGFVDLPDNCDEETQGSQTLARCSDEDLTLDPGEAESGTFQVAVEAGVTPGQVLHGSFLAEALDDTAGARGRPHHPKPTPTHTHKPGPNDDDDLSLFDIFIDNTTPTPTPTVTGSPTPSPTPSMCPSATPTATEETVALPAAYVLVAAEVDLAQVVTCPPVAPGNGGGLPVTGVQVGTRAGIGLLVLGLGIAMMLVGRRGRAAALTDGESGQ